MIRALSCHLTAIATVYPLSVRRVSDSYVGGDLSTMPTSCSLWEAAVEPGEAVAAGGLLGRLHSLHRPSDPPTPVLAPAPPTPAAAAAAAAAAGATSEMCYVMGVRTIVPSHPGDALCWTGNEISLETLWANAF